MSKANRRLEYDAAVTRALPILLVWLAAIAAAAAPDGEKPRQELPEASRWLSFVRLVEARWDMRTRVPPPDETARRELFDRCTHDAWYLARPGLLRREGPCGRLLGEPGERGSKARPPASREPAGSLDLIGYRRCVDRAADGDRPGLLDRCTPALEPGVAALRALDDEARFQSWFKACKVAILHDADPPDAAREAHARHCLRTLPTFYEVRWMKKLSEYWTADEQKRLYQRARQLGGD